MLRVAAVSGSLRRASLSGLLVGAIARLVQGEAEVEIYDGLASLPAFSPDLDVDPPPPPVVQLRKLLRASDAVLLCTPEYAYGMPGALKNALDWLVSSGELYRKPVAALSTGPSATGGERALAWLRQVLSAVDARVPEPATFCVPFVRDKLEAGRIADEALAGQLREAFRALAAAAAQAPAGDATS